MQKLGFVLSVLIAITLFSASSMTTVAQDEGGTYPVITAQNIRQLQSVQQLDFADIPANVKPASGLFAINADASLVVTFGNLSGEPPLSQAVLWGYGAESDGPLVNALGDSHVIRLLTEDGQCLVTGHTGYYAVWELDPTQDSARLLDQVELPEAFDTVNNVWTADNTTCNTDVYAEVFAMDGSTYVLGPDGEVLHTDLFAVAGQVQAGRVGRVQPPLAITMDFENHLYRWDMMSHEITATVEVNAFAIFGAVNQTGTYYAWQEGTGPDTFEALHLVNFEEESDRIVASYDNLYFSHLALPPEADVILGIDPTDERGTVSAWQIETGERIDLGSYRECERIQPDLVKLSQDGTALVIGCDKGIDIWRVVE